jgi:serine/threonine protein kinase
MVLEPGTVVERYTVEALLGQGAMAEVYRVRHRTLQTAHALKVLTLASPAIRERLIQ